MKIEVSESTLKTIICSLENYFNKYLDIDKDPAEMIVVAKALCELQGTYKALKDNKTEKQDENFRMNYNKKRNSVIIFKEFVFYR